MVKIHAYSWLKPRNANKTYSTTTRHRPDSSNQWWESTPKPEHLRPSPEMAPFNRPPKPGSGQPWQPTPGFPSRLLINLTPQAGVRVTRVPKNGRNIIFENELDTFRLNFLRIFMGTGIELGFMECYLLLGVRHLGVTSIAPSIKQLQPQYP